MSNLELYKAIEALEHRDLVVDVTRYSRRVELRFVGLSKTKYLVVKLKRTDFSIDIYVLKLIDGMQLLITTEVELNEVIKDLQRAIKHELKTDWLGINELQQLKVEI